MVFPRNGKEFERLPQALLSSSSGFFDVLFCGRPSLINSFNKRAMKDLLGWVAIILLPIDCMHPAD